MKRRLAAYAVCILLVLQMPFPTVRAEERVYFTAAGSYVLPLSDNTMPFWSGGYVYVASSIFTGAAREALNISQVLDSSQEWVVLYSGGLSLTFNLSANCALDNDGNAYYPGAIRRNGVVFVPANTVSRYFNLVYSVIEVEQGSMVWLRQPSYTMPDKLFADAAQYQLNTVYADYLRAKENTPPKGGTPDAPSRPTTPVSTEDPAAELDGKRIALCLAAGSDASAMVDALGSYDAGAALFFTPEEMTRQGETLRRVAASGQSIGILVNAGDPERTIPEQLEAGNEALFQAACCKTRLAYVPSGGQGAGVPLPPAGGGPERALPAERHGGPEPGSASGRAEGQRLRLAGGGRELRGAAGVPGRRSGGRGPVRDLYGDRGALTPAHIRRPSDGAGGGKTSAERGILTENSTHPLENGYN